MSGAATPATASRWTRILVLSTALALTALAWAYVYWLAQQMAAPMPATMPGMPGMPMSDADLMTPAFAPWTFTRFFLTFIMWLVMMVGMMTPSVTPMVLIYARVARQSQPHGRLVAPAAWFTCGYFVAWSLFSALAALAQWALEALTLSTPMMVATSHGFGGAVLIGAGVYQWLPIKEACLSYCRAPLAFLQRHGGIRPGAGAALRLGMLHGGYCIGCCWALMLVLFVVGVMNLLWIAALMVVVLLEKVIPAGRTFSRLLGCAAIAAGIWMLAH